MEPTPFSTNFYFIGDTGEANEQLVTLRNTLRKSIAKSGKPEAFILLGDNFYPYGVSSVDDPQFKTGFEDVFREEEFECPWQVILGNHDYYGNAQAQIDYTSLSSRWNLPAKWYSKEYSVLLTNGKKASMLMVFLDTWSLDIDHTKDMMFAAGELNLNRVLGTRHLLPSQRREQIDWLKKTLEKSSHDFKVVCGHYPVYSHAQYGNSLALQKILTPLFNKYHVSLYLNGHDHIMQVIEKNNITYCTSGLSCREPSLLQYQECSADFMSDIIGFTALKVFENHLELRIINGKTGEVAFSKIIKKAEGNLEHHGATEATLNNSVSFTTNSSTFACGEIV